MFKEVLWPIYLKVGQVKQISLRQWLTRSVAEQDYILVLVTEDSMSFKSYHDIGTCHINYGDRLLQSVDRSVTVNFDHKISIEHT